MTDLLDLAIKGHGGRRRWKQIARIVATMHGRRPGLARRDTAR